eukprot:3099656-Rhodomonas_salina.1
MSRSLLESAGSCHVGPSPVTAGMTIMMARSGKYHQLAWLPRTFTVDQTAERHVSPPGHPGRQLFWGPGSHVRCPEPRPTAR